MDTFSPSTLLLHAAASDLVHHDDDAIELRVVLSAVLPNRPNGRPRDVVVDAIVHTQFWSDARVETYDAYTLPADVYDETDQLVLALFEVLAARVRRWGVPDVGMTYLNLGAFLRAHLPAEAAGRMAAALAARLPPYREGDDIAFSVP